jgi:hypothetical protein
MAVEIWAIPLKASFPAELKTAGQPFSAQSPQSSLACSNTVCVNQRRQRPLAALILKWLGNGHG